MKAISLLVLIVGLLGAAPAPAPSATPSTFTDPAMSFTSPPGYTMAPGPPHDPANFDQPTVVAAWVRHQGQEDQSFITIRMENFEGDLQSFQTVNANEIRNNSDSVLIRNKGLTTLSNGMPAYFIEVQEGEGFDEVRTYAYIWVDHVRGVVLSITSRAGIINESDARKLLAGAAATAYPRRPY
jgi:hypothetical protein